MRLRPLISFVYLASSIAGALLVAMNVGQMLVGYALFFTSSVLGAYLAYNSNVDRSMLWVNVVFGVINVIGFIRWWS